MNTYHFIGIGGIGMSALARIASQKGAQVRGSDAKPSYVTEALQDEGIEVFTHHSEDHLASPATVVYSTAIKEEHVEFKAAKEKAYPVLHRSDLLAHLMQDKKALLVAGTHGKTTTSSLLAHVLHKAGLDPSYAIGGTVVSLGSNGGYGKGDYFVAEADESDGSFSKYSAYAAIVTNIEPDHLDYWKDLKTLIQGFRSFITTMEKPENLIWCADDPELRALKPAGLSYGFSPDADIAITRSEQRGWEVVFDLRMGERFYREIHLPSLGQHNILNGAAVFALALNLGVPEPALREGFRTFCGVKRRMEKKGEKRGVAIYDDYGHHPTEVETTLKGARRACGEKRLITAFQPHRYTRTQDLWSSFLTCFDESDILVLTDIYSAGEKPIEGITGKALFEAVSRLSLAEVHFVPRSEMAQFIARLARPHDVIVTMGAGDITALGSEILAEEIKPLKLALISGGKSSEHEVALSSRDELAGAIDPHLYEITHFTLSKKGIWDRPFLELQEMDLAFPIMHGPFGEDGMIQGFLETLGIPYVGCDFRSSAVAMDKAWTKRIALTHGVPTAPFLEFTYASWLKNSHALLTHIEEKFSFPLFIKPVHLGSTLGVSCVATLQEIPAVIEKLSRLDNKFIVEAFVEGREIEFGFLGCDEVLVSEPAEVVKSSLVYSYADKYGEKAAEAIIKVSLPPEVLKRGKELAKTVYLALNCTGFARIDFFLQKDGEWILNEVNPIPGCTPTSVYPKIWDGEGLTRKELVNRLVISALYRARRDQRHFRSE